VLEVAAISEDGVVQAVRHRDLPIPGVQFHPESIMTPEGKVLLANFLAGEIQEVSFDRKAGDQGGGGWGQAAPLATPT